MRRLLISAAFAVLAIPAFAEDAALLMGVERYRTLDRFPDGADVTDAARALSNAGYKVDTLKNSSAGDMRALLEKLQARSVDADRLVVALSGRFATDGGRSWLLSRNAPVPSLFGIAQEGISIESVLQVMAATPGQSILLLAYDKTEKQAYDVSTRTGIGGLDIPQGVTVILGDPENIKDLIETAIVVPNAELVAPIAANSEIVLRGYRPKALIMQHPAERRVVPSPWTPPVSSRSDTVDPQKEAALWRRMTARDTVDAYRDYLRRYPRGQYAQAANDAIEAIRTEPNRAARLTEEGLGLTRDKRRAIQRDLSILNYNTRGTDGIFGAGTRAAITNWQQENGISQTSYLTDEQISRIDGQATRRAAQIEAEAAREREAQLRRDRAFWDETGANGGEAGLRSYLDRFPDGVYADRATTQLEKIQETKLNRAARADRNAWTTARETNTQRAYQTYLRNQPNGSFRDEAEARRTALRNQQTNSNNNAQARATEEALGLNALTRRLAETQLSRLGLDPGPVDGTFDGKTRRAIREYQRSRNLEPTGFLTQIGLIQLLVRIGN